MKIPSCNEMESGTEHEARIQRNIEMFGDIKENILQDFDDAPGEPKMKVMSILSDVQEETSMGNTERARQLTNVAKMLMMERL